MADNTTLNSGTGGDVIATDDIGGAKYQRMKLIHGVDGTNDGDISRSNPLPVGGGFVSTANSTTANLAGAAVFTGTSEDISQYSSVTVSVYTSHASATDGLSIQQSTDGTNWDITDVYTVPAVTGKTYGIQIAAKFFRVVYTNGATLTTTLRLQTIFHSVMPVSSSVRPQDSRPNDNDMAEMLGYNMLYDSTTNTWSRQKGVNGAAAVAGSQAAVSTTSWTSGTGVNTANTVSTIGMNTVTVAMNNTSTMTAGVLTFEVSPDGGTTWFPISMARIDSYTVENTYTLNTVAARAWSTSADGFTNFRVRLSTVITGTGTASVFVTAQAMPIEPIVVVGQSQPSNLSANIGTINGTAPLMGNGVTGTGSLRVTIASDNTAHAINIAGRATGGATTFTLISAASTNATSVKASAGTLKALSIGNNGAGAAYVKFFNKASAPTVGTDTPVATYYIPAGSGREVQFPPEGNAFATGIAYSITGVGTVADTTAVAVTQVFLTGSYV